jgi:hypothetical protein
MQPMNYTLDVKNPFEGALQGVQAGFNISNAMDQSQAQQLALQQKQAALDQQKQMQTDLGALAQKQNPSAQDFAQITTKYPQLAEHFKNTWNMLNSDQQQARLGQATQVYAALQSGKPEIAKDLLTKQVQAAKNSGNEQDAQAANTMLQMVDLHPQVALNSAGLMLSSVLGPDKFATTFSTLAKLPGEVRKGEAEATKLGYEAAATPARLDIEQRFKGAEIRNLDSQIGERSSRLGLDRDKLQSEVEMKLYELNQKNGTLPEFINKDLSAATTESISAQQSAARMNDLAGQIDKAAGELGGGVTAKAGEFWKKTFGDQNELTRIRSEYARIVTPAAMAAYKQVAAGSTSDKDIETAMTGVPSDTASPERMASFLRGAAKLQTYDSVLNNAKAEWLGSVQSLGKAKSDVTIDGVAVPAGTTFKQFVDNYVPQKVKAVSAQQEQAAIPARSYMRHAQGAK